MRLPETTAAWAAAARRSRAARRGRQNSTPAASPISRTASAGGWRGAHPAACPPPASPERAGSFPGQDGDFSRGAVSVDGAVIHGLGEDRGDDEGSRARRPHVPREGARSSRLEAEEDEIAIFAHVHVF